LDGGNRKSPSAVAASSCLNRIAARSRISAGMRFDRPVLKKRSVSTEAKERIINCKLFVYGKKHPRRMSNGSVGESDDFYNSRFAFA
jgi:hypothetical protein